MPDATSAVGRARGLLSALERETESVLSRTDAVRPRAPLDSNEALSLARFICAQRLRTIENDLNNLCVSVAKARNEREMLFMHDIALREDSRLTFARTLARSLRGETDDEPQSPPAHARCELRTTFLSRLTQYGTAGQIALSLWFESRVAAHAALFDEFAADIDDAAASEGPIVFDRLEGTREAFEEQMLKTVATDLLIPDCEPALRRASIWTVHYEATVVNAYYEEGLAYAERTGE